MTAATERCATLGAPLSPAAESYALATLDGLARCPQPVD